MTQRVHAALIGRAGSRHNRYVDGRKRALLGGLTGEVLEVGPGGGANFPYLPTTVGWIGVEPNPYLKGSLEEAAAKRGRSARVVRGTVERLPLADASVDAVVATLLLCSVADVAAALSEIRRVLRPGGRFVFVEHVAAEAGTFERRLQRALRPIWTRMASGCAPDRETAAAIESAGFRSVELDRFRIPVPLIGPHIAGSAIR